LVHDDHLIIHGDAKPAGSQTRGPSLPDADDIGPAPPLPLSALSSASVVGSARAIQSGAAVAANDAEEAHVESHPQAKAEHRDEAHAETDEAAADDTHRSPQGAEHSDDHRDRSDDGGNDRSDDAEEMRGLKASYAAKLKSVIANANGDAAKAASRPTVPQLLNKLNALHDEVRTTGEEHARGADSARDDDREAAAPEAGEARATVAR